MAGNYAPTFSLNFFSIFVHISGSIRPVTLTWASLERSFPFAEVDHRWCQFWSKVMTSVVEERPRFFMGGYGWHRSQWVKLWRHLRVLDDLNFFRWWSLRLLHRLLLCLCGFTFDLIVLLYPRKPLQPRKPAAKRQPLVTKSFTVPSSAGRRKKMEETRKGKGQVKSLRIQLHSQALSILPSLSQWQGR